jgi:hypothetical protein
MSLCLLLGQSVPNLCPFGGKVRRALADFVPIQWARDDVQTGHSARRTNALNFLVTLLLLRSFDATSSAGRRYA